ncbi:hypothetical protein M9H77_07113 [Catharanthus roseus]|uniref:Uncharacterized protein n=1 Tax=Catharanthus roseus TaxID=4058 RepID=A0ACC0BTZ6_CATRO|nr:hypothetical protein M9H77_07113 [Catharanthus roseus]
MTIVGKYPFFCSVMFSAKFYKLQRKIKEGAEVLGIVMPDKLQLMVIVACSMRRGRLYRAGLGAAHLIAESSRAVATLVSCCLDHEQRLIWRVEDIVSRASSAFDEHMRWLFKHNHLAYILFPSMMPHVRVAISVDPSISSSTTAAAGTSAVPTRDSVLPPLPPSLIHALGSITPLPYPTDSPPTFSRAAI